MKLFIVLVAASLVLSCSAFKGKSKGHKAKGKSKGRGSEMPQRASMDSAGVMGSQPHLQPHSPMGQGAPPSLSDSVSGAASDLGDQLNNAAQDLSDQFNNLVNRGSVDAATPPRPMDSGIGAPLNSNPGSGMRPTGTQPTLSQQPPMGNGMNSGAHSGAAHSGMGHSGADHSGMVGSMSSNSRRSPPNGPQPTFSEAVQNAADDLGDKVDNFFASGSVDPSPPPMPMDSAGHSSAMGHGPPPPGSTGPRFTQPSDSAQPNYVKPYRPDTAQMNSNSMNTAGGSMNSGPLYPGSGSMSSEGSKPYYPASSGMRSDGAKPNYPQPGAMSSEGAKPYDPALSGVRAAGSDPRYPSSSGMSSGASQPRYPQTSRMGGQAQPMGDGAPRFNGQPMANDGRQPYPDSGVRRSQAGMAGDHFMGGGHRGTGEQGFPEPQGASGVRRAQGGMGGMESQGMGGHRGMGQGQMAPQMADYAKAHAGHKAIGDGYTHLLAEKFFPQGDVDVQATKQFLASIKQTILSPVDEGPGALQNSPMGRLMDSAGLAPPRPLGNLSDSSSLKQCLTDYADGMKEMMQWMQVFSANKMECGLECKERLGVTVGDGAKQCMAEQKAGMLKELLMGVRKGPEAAQALRSATHMFAATCRPEAGAEEISSGSQFLRGPRGLGSSITGHMCLMATMSTLMSEDFEECECDCVRERMARDGMEISPDLVDVKISFFTAVQQALQSGELPAMPPQMARHDKMQGAACLFRHCDVGTLAAVMRDSGLSRLHKEHSQMLRMAKATSPQACQCMQQVMPSAAFFRSGSGCEDLPRQLEDQSLCAQRVLDYLQRMRRRMPAPQ